MTEVMIVHETDFGYVYRGDFRCDRCWIVKETLSFDPQGDRDISLCQDCLLELFRVLKPTVSTPL